MTSARAFQVAPKPAHEAQVAEKIEAEIAR
jgi:hypothetical protein